MLTRSCHLIALLMLAALLPVLSGFAADNFQIAFAAPATPSPRSTQVALSPTPELPPSPTPEALASPTPVPVIPSPTEESPPAEDTPVIEEPPATDTPVTETPTSVRRRTSPTATREAPSTETLAPGMPTPTRSRSVTPATGRSTQSATATPANWTIDPRAAFVPAYISVVPPSEDPAGGQRSMLRGKVMDRRLIGIGGLTVAAWKDDITRTTRTGKEGEYTFSGLPSGLYNVQVESHPGRAAENIQIDSSTVTVIEFVESVADPNATNSPVPVIASSDQPAGPEESLGIAKPDVSVAPTAVVEASRPMVATRRTPPASSFESLFSDLPFSFDADPWIENLLLGAAAAYALLLLGLAYATVRRQG